MFSHQALLELLQVVIHEHTKSRLFVCKLPPELMQQVKTLGLTIVEVCVDLFAVGEISGGFQIVLRRHSRIVVMCLRGCRSIMHLWQLGNNWLLEPMGISVNGCGLPPVLIALVLRQVQIEVQLATHGFK